MVVFGIGTVSAVEIYGNASGFHSGLFRFVCTETKQWSDLPGVLLGLPGESVCNDDQEPGKSV